jgi:hypothetical protein
MNLSPASSASFLVIPDGIEQLLFWFSCKQMPQLLEDAKTLTGGSPLAMWSWWTATNLPRMVLVFSTIVLGLLLDVNNAVDVGYVGLPKVDTLDNQNADLGGVS